VVVEAVVDRDVPLLPPFPAGEAKLETMHKALDAEDGDGHGSDLLRAQADQERRARGG
jgi:pyruvate dehydrogenase (quinone)